MLIMRSRCIPIACISITVISGVIIKQYLSEDGNAKTVYLAAIVLILICPLAFFGQYLDQVIRINYLDSADVDTDIYQQTDYLRVNKDGEPVIMPRKDIESEGAEILSCSNRGFEYNLHIRTSDNCGVVKLPLDNYKGYRAFD